MHRLSLLLCLLLGLRLAGAQQLPPPGGWPLRPVTELQAVPEPPGGLLPYRQGKLWGFADTTGRVWIRPVFATEPPLLSVGFLLVPPPGAQPAPNWGARYGEVRHWAQVAGEPYTKWESRAITKLAAPGLTQLINARGEQLLARPGEALWLAPGGTVRVGRRAGQRGKRELVAIEAADYAGPGRLLTTALARRAPVVPRRLRHWRYYTITQELNAGPTHLYLAQRVRWLPPRYEATWHGRCGFGTISREQRHGLRALFDQLGRRLTAYRYLELRELLPRRLAYMYPADSTIDDSWAAEASGLPAPWRLHTYDSNNKTARFGLLDLQGHELTPPLFVLLRPAGPNALWAVAVRHQRLYYGLLDTLGHYLVPLRPEPLSLLDAAGLLRRRSAAPLACARQISQPDTAAYADTATVSYLGANGQPAFAGRFKQASAFWQGRALVRQGAQYGIIDTLGRWVLPPQPERLRFSNPTTAQYDQRKVLDPLGIFDHFGPHGHYLTLPEDSVLLLTSGPQGYGLRGSRTGRVVVPATVFDSWPDEWHGALAGKRQQQPWGISLGGQPFDPRQPATWPAGVAPLLNEVYYPVNEVYYPAVVHTNQGYRTRGGRQLWQE